MAWAVAAMAVAAGLWIWSLTRKRNSLELELFDLQRDLRQVKAEKETAKHQGRYFKTKASQLTNQVKELREVSRDAILELDKHSPDDAARLVRERFNRVLPNQKGNAAGTGKLPD